MPVLNREKYLPPVIQSLQAQTLVDWELIISDGGSTDTSRDLLTRISQADPRVRWFDHPGLNIPQARNALLSEARGEFIAVLDSDDLACPERLRLQTDFLRRNPEFVGVGSNMEAIDDNGTVIPTQRYPLRLTDPDLIRKKLLLGWGCFIHTSMLFLREAVQCVGGYRAIFRHAEDDDIFLRLTDSGKLTNLPESLVQYRCHEENAVRPGRYLHRAVALSSAHNRLHGLPDPVNGREEPFDFSFLEQSLVPLGAAALPVWLFWLGMLQFYRDWREGELSHAWERTLSLPYNGELGDEVLRHWQNYREKYPALCAETSQKHRTGVTGRGTVWDRVIAAQS